MRLLPLGSNTSRSLNQILRIDECHSFHWKYTHSIPSAVREHENNISYCMMFAIDPPHFIVISADLNHRKHSIFSAYVVVEMRI